MLTEFYAKVRPVGAWRRYRDQYRAAISAAGGSYATGQGVAVLVGWAGGAALIYGLMFLPGRWMLGDPWLPSLVTAAIGGAALRMAWRRAVA